MLTEEEIQRRERARKKKPLAQAKMDKYTERLAQGKCIAQIQLQYSYECNLHCEHCYITAFKPKNRKFTIPDVWELSHQANEMGLAQFTITGGEPLIFPDLDELVEALRPEEFYLALDTNGTYLTKKMAHHLFEIGVDKVQLSYDPWHGFLPEKQLEASLEAGLQTIIVTVVDKSLLSSDTFQEILEIGKKYGIGNYISLAKPVGSWAGHTERIVDEDDLAYLESLRPEYDVFTHLTPSYNLDMGCIAIKRQFAITAYGDVTPCPYIHYSLGNIFEEPLQDIIEKAMVIPQFAWNKHNTCLSAIDKDFMTQHDKDTQGQFLPVPWNYDND